jgi:uncharacterized protein YjbJ (UPF0337 family)
MGGEVDKVTGKVKEGMGKAADDPEMESEGKTQNVKGRLQDAVDTAKDAARGIKERITGE